MMKRAFEVKDKTSRKIYITKERLGHIKKHPKIQNKIEDIKSILKNLHTIKRHEIDEDARYYYGYFKDNDPLEKYLLILVKYLNGEGFIITAFFTNKIGGLK